MSDLGSPNKATTTKAAGPVGASAGGFSPEGREALDEAEWTGVSPSDLIDTAVDVAQHPGEVAGFVGGAVLEGVRELVLGPVLEVLLTIVLTLIGLGLVAFAVVSLAARTSTVRALAPGG